MSQDMREEEAVVEKTVTRKQKKKAAAEEAAPETTAETAPAMGLSDIDRALLLQLLALPGAAGDEGHIAAFLEGYIEEAGVGVTVTRVQDSLIAVRGKPRTAIFAHIDTIGFTLGYDRKLLPIGSPAPKDRDALRCTAPPQLTGTIRLSEKRSAARGKRPAGPAGSGGPRLTRIAGGEAAPGTRWVYAAEPVFDEKKGRITSPYLDNRAGVWAALRTLLRSKNVAVAFTAGEEQHGHGARVCAEKLYRDHGIGQALIADITWDTDDTPVGKGVVLSLRDAYCPRQSFLDRVLAIADSSEISHQREVQSAGSSDGGHILRSSVPMDWVFVGAPEKRPHTAREEASLTDLEAMTDLLTLLVEKL